MIIGYCRTSTLEQTNSYENQKEQLLAAGCEKLFCEQISSVANRPELEALLEFCREGDVLVVTKLDRLARSIKHLWSVIERLEGKGVSFKVIDLGIDTSSPTGKLILTLLGGVAQFEREMMLERQREGIQKAKAAGKYKGRKPTARIKSAEVKKMWSNGAKASNIAKELSISVPSVYRILRQV